MKRFSRRRLPHCLLFWQKQTEEFTRNTDSPFPRTKTGIWETGRRSNGRRGQTGARLKRGGVGRKEVEGLGRGREGSGRGRGGVVENIWKGIFRAEEGERVGGRKERYRKENI
jgi:hypothetical protein